MNSFKERFIYAHNKISPRYCHAPIGSDRDHGIDGMRQ